MEIVETAPIPHVKTVPMADSGEPGCLTQITRMLTRLGKKIKGEQIAGAVLFPRNIGVLGVHKLKNCIQRY